MSDSPTRSPGNSNSAKNAEATRRGRRRWLPWTLGGALLALVVAGLWPKPLPVELATVARGDVMVTVNEEGMTRVQHRYVVSSPVAGELQRIEWKAGAPVVAGQTVLARLTTSGADLLDARGLAQAEARVRAAAANREAAVAQAASARAAAELAKSDLARFQALAERKAISTQELETATMREAATAQELRAAEFGAQVAGFEWEQARAALLRGQPETAAGAAEKPLEILSPVSGHVLRVMQESARVVPAGLALLEVGDETDIELRIEVLSRDGVAIRPGARVIVEQWGGDHPLEARVRLVEPSAFTKISALGVEEQRVYVIADLVDPVAKRPTLGDNYRIEGRVVVWEGKNVLHVPTGALFQRGGEWQIFVLRGARVERRTVQVGRSNGLETEVVAGLAEGERVVVYPGDKIDDGVRVRELTVGVR